MKSNVRRGPFYLALTRSAREENTVCTVDVAAHAAKRKLLNLCFTEKSVRAACGFTIKHIDRWHELMSEENHSYTEWSAPLDLSERIDALIFDIMGDLAFGKSFDIKEPGDNPLKVIPHSIAAYMKFYYPVSLHLDFQTGRLHSTNLVQMCRSPFLNLLVWLKPRGLDKLFKVITPPAVEQYNKFIYESVTNRIRLHNEQGEKPESEQRQDLLHFLIEAQDPETGLPAFNEQTIRAESSLLIIAGSDTTAISLAGVFFYLTGDPWRLQKLTAEVLSTFEAAEDIVYGPKLSNCAYLRACIEEGMRLVPSGPSELSREVLSGGIQIKGEHYPAGTIVGTLPWANSRSQEAFGDPETFRPERWIADESTGVSKEDVAWARKNFHPFISGPGNCVGRNLAMAEMMLTVARTLYRFEIRRNPGSTLGGGSYEKGWGARDERQQQVLDAYISLRKGPEVQFRRRAV
jgi:cytochrome P450